MDIDKKIKAVPMITLAYEGSVLIDLYVQTNIIYINWSGEKWIVNEVLIVLSTIMQFTVELSAFSNTTETNFKSL